MDRHISELVRAQLSELLSSIDIGAWDWDLRTGGVIYSAAWAEILGYAPEELLPTVGTWERMVLPEDLPYANLQIEKHLQGKCSIYEAEFRMICKDGSVIWAQDKGRITEYDSDGKPLRFTGVLQNVSRLKNTELQLRENQATLDFAVNVAALGTWDWDIVANVIRYNDEYLRMLGYTQSDMDGSIEEWIGMNHPEDLPFSNSMLSSYLAGEIPAYACEIRMQHRDGHYIWTRDVGKVVARDAQGKPTRLIGGHLNIDTLKRSEAQLTDALAALENNNLYLEHQVNLRTAELLEQDKMLWTVNLISRKLLTFRAEDDFNELVKACLCLLGESINKNRVYIWKDRAEKDGRTHCTQIYEWVRGVSSIQDSEFSEDIAYDDLPTFAAAIAADHCLNSAVRDLAASERAILEPRGIQTILIAPIAINGNRWGFIGVDNCDDDALFSRTEESTLLMSGSMLASAIEKMEREAQLREVEGRTQLMLDATPLCCNLWSPEFCNTSCNEEAVRLFELSSQEEYLSRFYELSPEYQPGGQRSTLLALSHLQEAFATGYKRFEWLHQKLDGTPIPSEITLVRVRYKDGNIVAGYTRDLREFKGMLAQLQAQEDALRSARDEALLSSKAKSNFLANMSHEIRTPMNAISGLAEIIMRESRENSTKEYAKGITTACGSLLNIINDILDISKIESGKLELFNSEYEFASLLNDVLTVSRMRLGSKPLMFITDIDSHLPAQMIGDELRIKQILINLLSNAIKFTQSGFIALRVSGTIHADQVKLCFSVRDSGHGVAADDLARIFAEFERVNTKKNRAIEGTGLGLAITKQLCEMMGGEIRVQSVYGEGSDFTVTIPQQCSAYTRLSVVEEKKNVLLYEPRDLYRASIVESLANLGCRCTPCANQSELYNAIHAAPYDYILGPALHFKKLSTLTKQHGLTAPLAVFANYGEVVNDPTVYTTRFPVSCMQLADLLNGNAIEDSLSLGSSGGPSFIAPTARVLVVDDNPVNLRVAEGLMAPYQFHIDTAENGAQAVSLIQREHYDLVFMDHMMPEMDGIDATAVIRQLPAAQYQSLPIIALTANALVGTREMFIREGMNDFLAKPIEVLKLGQILAKWLPPEKRVKQDPQSAAHTDLHTDGTVEAFPFLIAGVNTTRGLACVGGSNTNYLQILAAYYADGKQKCISLREHFAADKISAFRTEIHAVKSTSATIGAMELSAAAATLETAAQNQDKTFIGRNLDGFLTQLNITLAAIRPVIASASTQATPMRDPNPCEPGKLSDLRALLHTLAEAAELARIGQIEDVMAQLTSASWPEPVFDALSAIQACLDLFDYDGVLSCVERLSDSLA